MKQYPYEVKVDNSDNMLGSDAVDWLIDRGWFPFKDWEINMHGGQKDYISIFFHDKDVAMIAKLSIS